MTSVSATFSPARTLQNLFQTINTVVDLVNIEFNSTGVEIQAIDAAKVCLVAVFLDAKAFTKYKCDEGLVVGVNIDNLNKVFALADDDDSITFLGSDGDDNINICIQGNKKYVGCQLRLFEIEEEKLSIPDTTQNELPTKTNSKIQNFFC